MFEKNILKMKTRLILLLSLLFTGLSFLLLSLSIPKTTMSYDIAKGKIVFEDKCSGCHRMRAEGSFGPNLTDNYFLHGHHYLNVHHIVKPQHSYNIVGISKTFNVILTASTQYGCSDSINKNITINANPKSDFSYVLNGQKINLKASESGNSNYVWMFGKNDSAATTTINYIHTFTNPGQYNICLKVSNAAGCSSQTCKNIMTNRISYLDKLRGIEIFPNPNTGSFTLSVLEPKGNISINIYNCIGELIKTIESRTSSSDYLIDLNLAKGVYFVKVINDELIFNQRMIIR